MKLFLFLLCFSTAAMAQLQNNKVFKVQGAKVITKLTTSNYVATHDLLYYIPKSVDLKKPTTIVFYLHGGNSNMTQERATDTADTIFWGTADGPLSRKDGIRPIADKLGFIVVMPTTTKGWNDQTPYYLRDVLKIVRAELNPHPEKIFLAGHSMGAMGITRALNRLADEFAMFLPISGGFQPHMKSLDQVGPFFNTKVWVTVGQVDFENFKLWNEAFEVFIKDKHVSDYFKASALADWTYELHPESHNPNIPLMSERFTKFFSETSRNLYQPELFGALYSSKGSATYIKDPDQRRYFWMEALAFRDLDVNETGVGINFRLYSKNNKIELMIDRPITMKYDYRPHLKDVRFHLSEKLFNLDQPIEVVLLTQRGSLVERSELFKGVVKRNTSASEEYQKSSGDRGYKFEAFLDVTLSRN
ncbi:MAG: hypothetical protein H0V66_16215 [Bdellovibrionales bacterium]|nr:hypothetical protein [Bdellovibrionales bacterium]